MKQHNIVWDNEKISKLWDYYSRTPPYSEVYFSKVFGEVILKESNLNLQEPLSVLDFGCGPGFIFDHLKSLRSLWSYTGLDFSRDSVDALNKKAGNLAGFKGAHHIEQIPSDLEGEKYDVILLLEVVEHLTDSHLQSTLTEVYRLLKKGGVLVVTTPNDEDLSKSTRFCPECGAIFHDWQHIRSWRPGQLSNVLEQYKLKVRYTKELDFSLQPFNVNNILRKIKRGLEAMFGVERKMPHMISVYQKEI